MAVEEMRWYHTLELPGGVVTPGEYDLRAIAPRLPWPALEGARCLDVGSRDGFYAFEMERRGAAEVVSLDVAAPADIHIPGGPAARPPDAAVQGELEAGNRAFEAARDALDSSVERVLRSVYELRAEEVGRFRFAVIATLLHHLRDPLRALAAVRDVLEPDGRLLLNEAVIPGPASLRRRPVAEIAPFGSIPFWLMTNPAGLRRMLEATGFTVIAAGRPYVVPYGPGTTRPPLSSYVRPPYAHLAWRLAVRRGAAHCWFLAAPAGE